MWKRSEKHDPNAPPPAFLGDAINRVGRECYRCRRPGHNVRDCPMPPMCKICLRDGHLAKDCDSGFKKEDNRRRMKEWEDQIKNRFKPTWTEDKSAREDRFEYKQAQQLVREGVALAKEGKHEDALKLYREALALDPIHADAHVAKGAVYVNQGKLKWGAAEFKRALKLDSKHLNANKYLEAVNKRIEMDEKLESSGGADDGEVADEKGTSGSMTSTDVAEGDNEAVEELKRVKGGNIDEGLDLSCGDGGKKRAVNATREKDLRERALQAAAKKPRTT